MVAAGVGCRDAGGISVMLSENASTRGDDFVGDCLQRGSQQFDGWAVVGQAKARRGGAKTWNPGRAL